MNAREVTREHPVAGQPPDWSHRANKWRPMMDWYIDDNEEETMTLPKVPPVASLWRRPVLDEPRVAAQRDYNLGYEDGYDDGLNTGIARTLAVGTVAVTGLVLFAYWPAVVEVARSLVG